MNDQKNQTRREHHFYVSIAKFLFYHPQHGIVVVRDPIRLGDAAQRGLVPIILYGITVAGLPIRWMMFTTVDQRKSFHEILLTAWRNAEGLRGRPDVLRVNRHVALADPGLTEALARIDVRLEIADPKDKTVSASLRSAQDSSRWLWQQFNPINLSLRACVEALCLDAQKDHDQHSQSVPRHLSNRNLVESFQKWFDAPICKPSSMLLEDRDWKAGPWLSSWEIPLPPDQSRYFSYDIMSRRMWLLMGHNPSVESDDDDENSTDEEYDNTPEIAKHLVACWPNPPKEIAAAAGITLRTLQWFTSERSGLDERAQYDLSRLLGIEHDERFGGYMPVGPYVLIAKKAQAIEAIYQEISGGGDASPCELVPAQGLADPSWRYILINAHSTPPTIVMAPRGEAITELLPSLIMNYEGIRPVSHDFYRDVVSTCSRACLSPQDNVRVMKEFAERYEQHWGNFSWLPD